MSASATVKTRYPSWNRTETALEQTPQPVGGEKGERWTETDKRTFEKLQEWWLQARETQALVRLEMDTDENFYHGDQFTQEDRLALEAVGQAPLVFNKTKPVIDWLIGTERRTRVDFNVLPRQKGKEKDAQVKKDVLKYISDTSKAPFARSEAFKEAAMSGLGWLEVGVRADETEEPIFIRQESWRNIWYDALGVAKDTSDWRYLYRSKWTDLDIAQAMFPDFAGELERCATSVGTDLSTSDDDEFYIGLRFSHRDRTGNQIGLPSYTDIIHGNVNNRRERVRLVECWYRMPLKGRKVKGGKHHGRVVNLKNQKMMFELNRDIDAGVASVYDAVVMQVKCAVFCENVLLQNMDSPYHHNRFPFVPVWAYRKGKFHEPYGVVRNCRDPQEDLNKRYSKALFLLSSTRIIADRNAVQDWESVREEVGRPDAQILLDTPGARFEINKEATLAEEQVKLMMNDGMHIQEVSGVTSENLGRDTNAISGRAVLAKQTQGSVVSAELFDNLRFSQQHLGELTLSTAEQFMDEEKAIRITGEKGSIHWRDINTPGEDGGVMNDITATQMDYIVSEQDFRDTMKQAMFESLSDSIAKMPPQVGLKLLDAVVELADFAGKDELVRRIRKINGELPPEEQWTDADREQAKAIQQKEQEQEQIQQQAIALEFAEKNAKVEKIKAEIKRILAEASQAGAGGEDAEALKAKLIDMQKRAATMEITMRQQLSDANKRLADRTAEIRLRAITDMNKANLDAKTTVEVAEIKAEVSLEEAEIKAKAMQAAEIESLNAEITALTAKLAVKKEKNTGLPTKKKAAGAKKK
jgi:hypothetical protein